MFQQVYPPNYLPTSLPISNCTITNRSVMFLMGKHFSFLCIASNPTKTRGGHMSWYVKPECHSDGKRQSPLLVTLCFKWHLLRKTMEPAQYGCKYIDVATCQLWCPHRHYFAFLQENPLKPGDQSGVKGGGERIHPPFPGITPIAKWQVQGQTCSLRWSTQSWVQVGCLTTVEKTSM